MNKREWIDKLGYAQIRKREWMCIYVSVFMCRYVCESVCVCRCKCRSLYEILYAYIYINYEFGLLMLSIYTCGCRSTHRNVCLCVHVRVYVCVCLLVFICIYAWEREGVNELLWIICVYLHTAGIGKSLVSLACNLRPAAAVDMPNTIQPHEMKILLV